MEGFEISSIVVNVEDAANPPETYINHLPQYAQHAGDIVFFT